MPDKTPTPSEAVDKILDNFGTEAIVTYRKDGSREPDYQKGKAEAAARIETLLIEARIEELKNIRDRYGVFRDQTLGVSVDTKAVSVKDINRRMDELRGIAFKDEGTKV